MEKSSKKTTPAKKRQPEQLASSDAAKVAKPEFRQPSIDDVSVDDSSKMRKKRWPWVLAMPVWTYVAFLMAQAIVYALVWLLGQLGVSFDGVSSELVVSIVTGVIYTIAILIAVLVPYKLYKRLTTKQDLGLPDLPKWLDILLAALTYIVYLITLTMLVALLTGWLSLELNNNQQLPFDRMLTSKAHYWMAFITLVVVVPFAEELLFRGYLYGKLRRIAPVWMAVLATSVTFGLAHLWAPGSPLQVMVAIDTFVLSIFLCLLREYTGAIWAAFLVHAIKNGLAFYVLFINPSMLDNIQAAVLSLF